MNILTRAEAIETCYPDLKPDQIDAYQIWVRLKDPDKRDLGQFVVHWLPNDKTRQLAVLNEIYPFETWFVSCEGILTPEEIGERHPAHRDSAIGSPIPGYGSSSCTHTRRVVLPLGCGPRYFHGVKMGGVEPWKFHGRLVRRSVPAIPSSRLVSND